MAKLISSGLVTKRLAEVAQKSKSAKQVEVGFLAGATYSDGTSVPMVAAIQEFGAPKVGIPPRPFFRTMIQQNKGDWPDLLAVALKMADFDAHKALELVGAEVSGELRQSIVDMDSPALSEVTLLLRERFGNNPQEIRGRDVVQAREDVARGVRASGVSTKPLVWTGHLLNSVDSQVE